MTMDTPDTPTASLHRPGHPPWCAGRNSVVPEADPHWLSEVLALIGVDDEHWAAHCAVRQSRVRAGTAFYSEGDPAVALYLVRHGYFKCLRFAENGYEHVLGFAGPGDVLGFEAMPGGRQPFGVVALEDSAVMALPFVQLEAWRMQSRGLDRALQRAVSVQLARARQTAEMMAAVASEVRLARFLVWMSERTAVQGQPALHFVLRMSRRDIASLLAVAHETVSRGIGLLADWGHVRVDNREVEIIDMPGLQACTRSTRRDMAVPRSRGRAAVQGCA